MRLLVTGGAGFIGSHVLRFLTSRYPDYTIVCADTLTYAANFELIADLENLLTTTLKRWISLIRLWLIGYFRNTILPMYFI